MRAALLIADVLATASDGLAQLQRLDEAGLRPVVLLPHSLNEGETVATGGFPQVSCAPDDPRCWGEQPELLITAASTANVALSEAFLVCHSSGDVLRATLASCRPVLVLGDQSLDDALGPQDPEVKDFAAALDLATAVDYMIEEAAQEAALGPFPYGPQRALEKRPSLRILTRGELLRVFGVVTIAGVAIGLGITYLLREAYKTYQFPPVAYYVTLQFLPQTWRGVLFLFIGAVIGAVGALFILSVLNEVPRRRSSS